MASKAPRRVSAKFLEFLASWEGLRLKAYKVPGEDFFTIGVGHTGLVDGKKITANTKITKAKALQLLKNDVRDAEEAVIRIIPEEWRRERRHFETMVSLVFNMGPEILTAAPPLTSFGAIVQKKRYSPANERIAAGTIPLYNKGGQPLRVMPGLVKRRRAERHMFLWGHYHHND